MFYHELEFTTNPTFLTEINCMTASLIKYWQASRNQMKQIAAGVSRLAPDPMHAVSSGTA